MAVNRYTQVNWNQPMSSYIGLPFEQLAKVGQTMQKNYEEGVQESYKLNDLLKTVPTINDPTLGLSNVKVKSLIDQKYAPKLEELTNRIVNQGDMSAKRDLNNLKREFTNDPLVNEAFESYSNYKAYKEDLIKKGGKYGPLLDDYRGTPLYTDETGLKPFRYHGMEDTLDIEGRFSKAMDSIKDDIKGWDVEHLGSDGIKIGQKGKQAGVTVDKVMGVAKNKVGTMLTQTDEGKQFVKKLRRLNPDITYDQILQEGVNALFSSASEQIGIERTSGSSVDVTPMYGILRKEGQEKEQTINSLIGQTIEGQTYNPIESDKTFQGLKESGVFKTDDKGNIKIDWLELNKPEKTYTQYGYDKGSVNRVTGEKPAISRQTEVANQMKKMADVVGYTGKIDADHYDLIASAYNVLNKSRLFGEQLSAPVSNLESDKITRNWDQTTAFNPNDINKLTDKPELKEGDKIVITERQTNSNGEIIKKGAIVNKDGKRTPIALKSNSLEDSGYFDKIGSIGINTAKFQVGEVKPINKTADGLSVIHETELPYVGYIATVGNPRDKSQVQYRVVTDDGQRKAFTNYSDLQRYLEQEYYTKVPEGKSDTQELINRKKQFETNFEE